MCRETTNPYKILVRRNVQSNVRTETGGQNGKPLSRLVGKHSFHLHCLVRLLCVLWKKSCLSVCPSVRKFHLRNMVHFDETTVHSEGPSTYQFLDGRCSFGLHVSLSLWTQTLLQKYYFPGKWIPSFKLLMKQTSSWPKRRRRVSSQITGTVTIVTKFLQFVYLQLCS